MSVVGDKVIFYEGKQTSLDFRLINKVIGNKQQESPSLQAPTQPNTRSN